MSATIEKQHICDAATKEKTLDDFRMCTIPDPNSNVCNGMDAPTFSGIVVCQSGGANQPLEQKERPI